MTGILGIDIYNSSVAFYTKKATALSVSAQLPPVQNEEMTGEESVSVVNDKQTVTANIQDNPIPEDVIYVLQNKENRAEKTKSADDSVPLLNAESDIENEDTGMTVDNTESEIVQENKQVMADDVETDDIAALTDVKGKDSESASGMLENGDLTDIEQIEVDNLKKTDVNIRRHERAHMNAGGQYAGAASYTYTEGPDGNRYATAGSVKIDTSEIKNNPRATIAKMQIVKRAALAPSDPSNEDRQVANKAATIESKARRDLKEKQNHSSVGNVRMLYNQMIMVYGKENVKDFSKFSVIAQDY